MKNSTKVIIAVIVMLLVATAGYGYQLLPELMTTVKEEMLTSSEKTLNGALSFDEVRLSGFMKVSIDNIELKDNDGKVVFTSPEVIAKVDLLKLATNSDDPVKAISSVKLTNNSKVFLEMNEQQQWNIQDLLKENEDKENSFSANILLDNLQLFVSLPNAQWQCNVTGSINAINSPIFAVDTTVKQDENIIKVMGNIDSDGYGALKITSDNVQVASFNPLVQELVQIKELSGSVKNLNLFWENKSSGNLFNGNMQVAGLEGKFNNENFTVHAILDGGLQVKDNKMIFSDFDALINGQKVQLAGGLLLQDESVIADKFSLSTKAFDPSVMYANSPWQGALGANLYVDGLLDQEMKSLLAYGDVSFTNGRIEGIALDNGKVEFIYRDKQLLLNKANINGLGGSVEALGEYNHETMEIKGTVAVKNIDVSLLPGNNDLAGILNGQAIVQGKTTVEDFNFTADLNSDALSVRGMNFKNLNTKVSRANGVTALNYAYADMGSGKITASGIVEGEPLVVNLRAGDLPLSEILPAVGFDGYGLLNVSADLTGSFDDLNGHVLVQATDGVIAEQPVKVLDGNMILQNNVLTIENFMAKMNYGLHVAEGSVDFSSWQNPLLNLRIISKSVRVEPIAALLLPDEHVTGNADSLVDISGYASNPNIKGDILLYEGSFREYFIEQVKGKYEFVDNGLRLNDFNVKVMQTSLFLDGYMDANRQLNFDFRGDNVRLENIPQIEDIVAEGGLELHGKLTGDINNPIFDGSIQADTIYINGQTLQNLSGEAWSEGGLNNYIRVDFEHGQGVYSLDAGLNYTERFAQGLMEVKDGDVRSLLAVAGQNDYDIDGVLNGTIELNRTGRRSGMTLEAQVTDGSVSGVPLEKIDLNLHLFKGKLTIKTFEAQQGVGRIIGRGNADLRGDLDLEFGGNDLDASLLTAFMKEPVAFDGNMNFLVQMSGATAKPDMSASIKIEPGSVQNVKFDNLYGLFSIKDDMFTIDQLFIAKDEYRASAYGSVPVDLFRGSAERKNPDAQMNIVFKLDNADLSIIPSIIGTDVEWGMGKTEGTVNVKGTLEMPLFYGNFAIREGSLKYKHLRHPLENMELAMLFEGDKVTLNNFSANMGAGSVLATGTLDLNDFKNPNNHILFKTDKLALASEMVTGPLTSDLKISPRVRNNKLSLLIAGDVLLENITINLPVVPEFGESGQSFGLNLTVHTGKNVRLYNKYLYDMLLEGNLHIQGSTNFPVIAGSVSATRGQIKYIGTPFKIETAKAAFPVPGTFMPTINLTAHSRISSVNITANITGSLSEMDVKLFSDPPMSQQEIFRLMTLKTLERSGDGGSDLTDDDMRLLLTAGLQMTFFGSIENYLKTSWSLDEFRIYQGVISGGTGLFTDAQSLQNATKDEEKQYNIYISKYLTRRLMLSYTTSLNNNDRRITMQYDIGRRMNLSASLDEDNKYFYGLEYRISF